MAGLNDRNRRHALRILAGCPNGATAAALVANGINPRLLERLDFLALIEQRSQTVFSNCGTISLRVDRYWITAAGRAYLQTAEVNNDARAIR